MAGFREALESVAYGPDYLKRTFVHFEGDFSYRCPANNYSVIDECFYEVHNNTGTHWGDDANDSRVLLSLADRLPD